MHRCRHLVFTVLLLIAAFAGLSAQADSPPGDTGPDLALAPLEYLTNATTNPLPVELYSPAEGQATLTASILDEDTETLTPLYHGAFSVVQGSNALTLPISPESLANIPLDTDLTLVVTAQTPGGELTGEEDYTLTNESLAAKHTKWTVDLDETPCMLYTTQSVNVGASAYDPKDAAHAGQLVLKFKKHKGGRVVYRIHIPITLTPGNNPITTTITADQSAKAQKRLEKGLGEHHKHQPFVKAVIKSHSRVHARVKVLVDFDLYGDISANTEDTGSFSFSASGRGGVAPYTYSWDFGDGSTGNGESATHTYAAAGSYTVSLLTVDSIGGKARATKTVTATGTLTVTASANPSSGPAPLTTALSSQASGGTAPYTYSWNLGDGGTSSDQNPTHTYTPQGSYTATVTAHDTNNATATASVVIAVTNGGGTFSINLMATPDTGPTPLVVSFASVVTGGVGPFKFVWDFGDGASTQRSQPYVAHIYTVPGSYTASILATDSTGATATASHAIQVTQPSNNKLRAAATASPSSGPAPLVVTFTGAASGGAPPYTFSWNFGDGATDTGQTVTHTYSGPGTYTVTFTVTDSASATVSVTATISVTTSGLTASISATPNAGQPPLLVNFTGSANGGVPPYSYAWDFGDGGTGTGQTPTHTYTSLGNYTTTLTVTDSASTPATASTTFPISVVATTLSAAASASPTSGRAPLLVNFTGSASGGVTPYNYSWNFGDSGTSTTQNPSHTYAAQGAYTAQLTVTDNSAPTPQSVTVTVTTGAINVDYPLLTATASASPTSGRSPLLVNFTGGAAGGLAPYHYSWTFGDGNTSTTQNPNNTYTSQGSYTVQLTVTDSETTPQSVTVTLSTGAISVDYPALSATATASPTSGRAPLPVNFTGSASGGLAPYTYAWTFGDSGTSTTQNPSHTYASQGSYTVQLTVTDSETTPQSVTVTLGTGAISVDYPVLVVTANGAPLTGMAPLAVNFTGTATGGLPPYNWTWHFGEGTPAFIQNPSHAYNAAGSFTVTLTVTDSAGTPQTATVNLTGGAITIYPALLVAAFGTPTSGNAPLAVAFSASASGGLAPYTYAWTFGDSGTGTGSTPAHTYNAAGSYTATVTVTDALSDTASANIPITVSAAMLTVTASASPTCGASQLAVSFVSTASGGVPPYTYSWNFGDSGTSTAQSPSHTYKTFSSNVTYTATVTVTDNQGWQATATAPTITVNPSGGCPGVLTVNMTAMWILSQSHFVFSAAVIGGTGPYLYDWDFGDGFGTETSTNSTYHAYSAPTSFPYHASVIVRDSTGLTGSATFTVNAPN